MSRYVVTIPAKLKGINRCHCEGGWIIVKFLVSSLNPPVAIFEEGKRQEAKVKRGKNAREKSNPKSEL